MFSKISNQKAIFKGRFIFLSFFVIFCFQQSPFAQNSSNPFELISRLDPVVQKKIEEKRATGAPDNPFDILKGNFKNTTEQPKTTSIPTTSPSKIDVSKNEPTVKLSAPERGFRQFIFIAILVMMVVFTLLLTLFRNYIGKAYNAFLNDAMMNQVYREKTIAVSFPYHILYILFFCNAGLFLLIATNHFGLQISSNNLQALFMCIVGVALVFILHHFLLILIGGIFPVSKEAGKYSFTIQIFNIIIGIALVPIILLIAFGPESLIEYLLPGFVILIGIVYFYRYIRGLFIANRYIAFHKFHFLLYICAAEIAPFLIIIKLLKTGGI